MKNLLCSQVTDEINQVESNAFQNLLSCEAEEIIQRPRSRELYYISKRTLQNAVRKDIELTDNPGIPNRLGAIFFIIVSQIFSTATALEPLLKERVLFIHENIGGYYRISTFFITKLVCDVLPMCVVPSLIFSLIAYYMTGLQRSFGQFFVFLLMIFISSVFGSATIPIFGDRSIDCCCADFCCHMMIFSGCIVKLSSLFSWISWLNPYLNISINGTQIFKDKELDYKTAGMFGRIFLH
ncbi:unnamed protein product [Adineta ricciae]|uniref:ABC-2 type transporter transmembrane domain-containing protein n=1 Tax=Adineta ricciae TaxID=249248 RepID=A0A815JJE5_ADIRI|nr:unnamed protein product [Adineta ricciae]CAF1379825.1 unnamed protein product [Adineta ricciae]